MKHFLEYNPGEKDLHSETQIPRHSKCTSYITDLKKKIHH